MVRTPATGAGLTVTSPAFSDGATIPRVHTCTGAGQSPELAWSGVPSAATSLALVVSDPDAPRGTFLHWLVYDIAPSDGTVAAGAVPEGAHEGRNSAGRAGWFPPCPPSGTHHYVFTVHALNGSPTGTSSQELLDSISAHTIASGSLTGLVRAG